MIPVLNSAQIREVDAYTIQHEPISSIDLMEKASHAFAERFSELVGKNHHLVILCGVGNNGGDGLAISRILKEKGYSVSTYSIGDLERASSDFKLNLNRLRETADVVHIHSEHDFPKLREQDIVIDAIFGSGLSRAIEGIIANLISYLNGSFSKIVSVDIASGLYADKVNTSLTIIKPWATISFQIPKLCFFQPSLSAYVGEGFLEDIGLYEKFIREQKTKFFLTEKADIASMIKRRNRFDHKGDSGRLLLIAGSKGKMGAAILAAKAGMRSGVGLLSVHAPSCGLDVLQSSVPEAMVSVDEHKDVISNINASFKPDAVAIGPGLGTADATRQAFQKFLNHWDKPIIVDADAINLLSENQELLELLPFDSILTPHPREFGRLVGEWSDDYHKLELMRDFCQNRTVNVVLKGAYSVVCTKSGDLYFNPSGNPGMATAGSGDALTGIVSSLVAQGYEPEKALKIGVYIHGLSGDMASSEFGEISLIASDIIDHIANALIDLSRK
ncbi:MAG: NAD(P)H-hydrate dehydratase [Cyclobacteriaceae bacterium]